MSRTRIRICPRVHARKNDRFTPLSFVKITADLIFTPIYLAICACLGGA